MNGESSSGHAVPRTERAGANFIIRPMNFGDAIEAMDPMPKIAVKPLTSIYLTLDFEPGPIPGHHR